MSDAQQNYTTPRGEVMWAFINGEGKTNKRGKKKFQASIVMSEEDAKPLVDVINDFWEENRPKESRKAKAPAPTTLGYRPWSVVETDEDGSPVLDEDGDPNFVEVPGMVEFFASTATTWPDGGPKKVKIYNAKGRETSIGKKKVGNKTIGKLGGLMKVYDVEGNYGVNLYLDGVQIFKFVEYVSGPDFQAEDYEDEDGGGWEGDENNFEGEEQEPAAPTNNKAKPRL